jgi:hypothetical protein
MDNLQYILEWSNHQLNHLESSLQAFFLMPDNGYILLACGEGLFAYFFYFSTLGVWFGGF